MMNDIGLIAAIAWDCVVDKFKLVVFGSNSLAASAEYGMQPVTVDCINQLPDFVLTGHISTHHRYYELGYRFLYAQYGSVQSVHPASVL